MNEYEFDAEDEKLIAELDGMSPIELDAALAANGIDVEEATKRIEAKFADALARRKAETP